MTLRMPTSYRTIIVKNPLESIISTIITKWGLVGVLVIAAGWVLWDNYKGGKKKSNADNSVDSGLQYITDVIDKLNTIYSSVTSVQSSLDVLSGRVDALETLVQEQAHPTITEEADRLGQAQRTSNLIYSAIRTNMSDISADHLFVGVLHNGTHSIQGVPFMKYDIIAEHFDIIRNPYDYDLYSRYKGTDIMVHNMLPQALQQQGYLHFDESNMELLQKLDVILYNKLVSRSIREISLMIIIGDHNMPAGFFGAYSFDKTTDVESFRNCGALIQDILNEN